MAPAPSVPRVEAPPPSVAAPQPPVEARSASSSSAVPPAPSAAEPAPPDVSGLNWDQGYLTVRSDGDEDVYATGFRIGRTNQHNLSKCGLRWVRLGRGDPPRWVSPGRTVDVKCRAVTLIDLAAE
ncbi:MAG: hypothetical protein DYH12_32455 [Sorangiineae bacterium PRO1]|nr:hypothetical protein [Sorangiineae bacterium PRO1]